MKSRWFESKDEAIRLRKLGLSIGTIERRLGIPRSTLSGWLRYIPLSRSKKMKLDRAQRIGLIRAREKAALWHRAQKKQRLRKAREEALHLLAAIDLKDSRVLELALALLYLGEGSKKKIETAMGSSDPLILRFFLAALKRLYGVTTEKIRCQLFLRADQNPQKLKLYWSRTLALPISCFKWVHTDPRTKGSKTYPGYHGVCNIYCGSVAIQRRLVYLGKIYCEKISEMMGA